MTAAIASDEIPDIQTQAHDITRRQLQEWFVWMDRIARDGFVQTAAMKFTKRFDKLAGSRQ
jgi:hypothetical protein